MITLLLSMLSGWAGEEDSLPEEQDVAEDLSDTGDDEEDEDTGNYGEDEDEDEEDEDEDDNAPRQTKLETPLKANKIQIMPMRMDMGTAFRTDTLPAFVLNIGTLLARSRHFALEANVGVMPMHALQYPGPWRSMMSWDFSADVTWLASRFVAVGPTAGAHYRMFNQQGSAIEQMFVPVAGVRMNATFLRARTWSFAIATKLTSDLTLTQIVLETQQALILPPVEGQIALRFNLGHGSVNGERP